MIDYRVYVGLEDKEEIIPKKDVDNELLITQVSEIINICKEYFGIPDNKRTKHNTCPERYIGLLIAFSKLNFPNYNTIATLMEYKGELSSRSAICNTLKKYEFIVKHDKALKLAYQELINIVTNKIKL